MTTIHVLLGIFYLVLTFLPNHDGKNYHYRCPLLGRIAFLSLAVMSLVMAFKPEARNW